jgi:hypothetical protein
MPVNPPVEAPEGAMRRVEILLAIAFMSAALPAGAFDAAGADIIGLRLGMPEADVVAGLKQQGFPIARDHGALTARTRDGTLTIDLTGDRGVRQIRYILAGRAGGEQEKIGISMIDRFGTPDQAKPMAWCRAIGRDGFCPEDGASLTYQPDALTMILRAGTSTRN